MSIPQMIVLAVVGSFVGGLFGHFLFNHGGGFVPPSDWIGSVMGAVIVLLIHLRVASTRGSLSSDAANPLGETMQISREQVLLLIRDRFGDQEAQRAADDLPDEIDHEQHADLLRKYHVAPKDFLQRFGGLGER